MMLSRRQFVQSAAATLAAFPIASHWTSSSLAANKPQGKAKSVIQIWMWGGPSHLETFDPKPGAGRDYCGSWDKPIQTNVANIEISQSLPQLAKCADLYSIVRGMTHGSFHHEVASYQMQTGREPGGGIVYPSVGAVISKVKGYDAGYNSSLPPYIVLTTAQGRFSPSGFLGPKYKPFVTGGDPSKSPFLVSGYVVEGITEQRQQRRKELLNQFDLFGQAAHEDEFVGEIDSARSKAFDLLQGDAAKTFDLASESEKVRESYGLNWFGQACLMARRLAQKEVPYITINYRGWDTHRRHFETLTRRQGEWDQGLAMLLKDLADLGLLDSTIVWWSGEFGRTPKIGWESPWFGGRGHFGTCFNAVLAGGGFRGGKVVGETNKTGEQLVSRPVYPQDFLGSIYQMVGIDPDAKLANTQGFDVAYMPKPSEQGRLVEIM